MGIKVQDVPLLEEVFTHIDDVTGEQRDFAVTSLTKHLEERKWEVCVVPVTKEQADFCIQARGVERDRLEALAKRPESLKKPIILVEMPKDQQQVRSHLMVDGTHRYVLYSILEAEWIPAYMIPWEVAEPFLIEGLPKTTNEELQSHYSHITLLREIFGGHGVDGGDDDGSRQDAGGRQAVPPDSE